MMTYNEIENNNLVVFKSIRGSHLYGLNTPESDLDTFGVYCSNLEDLCGTGLRYKRIVSDEKQDNYYDELQKYFIELGKSNPDVLISLFTPEDKILIKDPCLDPLFELRESLLTKACFNSFRGYAKSQINRMKGLHKAMNIDPEDVKERKTPLSFSWVPRPGDTGAWSLEKWLRENGLKQQHCGIARIPNGVEFYTLWYDWFADKDLSVKDYARLRYGIKDLNVIPLEQVSLIARELREGKKTTNILYRGILDPDCPDSTQLRCSSIPKSLAHESLCSFQFNQDAFKTHCSDYKAYWNWVKTRNQKRYENNLGHQWDSKNTSHALRIMRMATEIAEGKGMILDRRKAGDRDFLLDVKTHKFSYEEVRDFMRETEEKMKSAFAISTLPLEPNKDLLEDLLIDIRFSIYKKRYF